MPAQSILSPSFPQVTTSLTFNILVFELYKHAIIQYNGHFKLCVIFVIITHVTVCNSSVNLIYFSCANIKQFIIQPVTGGCLGWRHINDALMNVLVCPPACFLSRTFLSDKHRAWK